MAFQTRRKEILNLELVRLRGLAKSGRLVGDELENVLNALEMLSLEMWDMQDCLGAIQQLESDMHSSITGLHRLTDVMHKITQAGIKGEELPTGGPEAVRQHFNEISKAGGEGL